MLRNEISLSDGGSFCLQSYLYKLGILDHRLNCNKSKLVILYIVFNLIRRKNAVYGLTDVITAAGLPPSRERLTVEREVAGSTPGA